jgi:hypothetical protein
MDEAGLKAVSPVLVQMHVKPSNAKVLASAAFDIHNRAFV